jgi:hypothetical protein
MAQSGYDNCADECPLSRVKADIEFPTAVAFGRTEKPLVIDSQHGAAGLSLHPTMVWADASARKAPMLWLFDYAGAKFLAARCRNTNNAGPAVREEHDKHSTRKSQVNVKQSRRFFRLEPCPPMTRRLGGVRGNR